MNGANRHELKWQLVRSFFRSRSSFLEIFERYEDRVLEFSEELKTHRSRLKLEADDLLSLMDFKSLEELRDREILVLKQTAHLLFRTEDETDRFDHYVANIYHELSILKEEHYTVKEDFLRWDRKEYERFFREVAEFYPKRLRHVRNLYGKALSRLEELLPSMSNEPILVRSLYLFGGELLKERYPGGLVRLYRKMYTELGEVEGFAVVARGFLAAGFEEEALEAFRKASDSATRRRRKRRSNRLHALTEEILGRVEELEQALSA